MLTHLPFAPFAPCPAPFNMAAHVLHAGRRTPDKIAVSVLGRTKDDWTYAALNRAVYGVARGLAQTGLPQGSRVLMRMGNRIEFPIVFLGAIAAGLIPVPTSAALTAPEVAAITAQIAPQLCVCSDGLPAPDTCPQLGLAQIHRFYGLPPLEPVMGAPDRPAYIIFTSGTSAKPRAVLHAHRAVWARQMMLADWTGLGRTDRVLHAGGFNWTYTLGTGLMDPWAVGGTALIIPDALVPHDRFPALFQEHAISVFAAVPGIYRTILKHHMKINLSHPVRYLSAGEKLSDGLRARWMAATDSDILEAYGMSECSTFLSDRSGDTAQGLRPQSGRRIALTDHGTIAVHKSDQGLMLGYLDDPEATQAKYCGDWFDTGDQARLLDDGSLQLLGRADDMINAGGFRVSPLEVESVLGQIAGIDEVAVTQVRLKADVAVIAAFYTAAAPLPEDRLHSFAAARLARYKQPRLYIHSETLPKGPNNKILRSRLRQTYEAQHDQT